MVRKLILIAFILPIHLIYAQDQSVDTIQSIGEIYVKGFETNRKLLQIPASVSVLGATDLYRFSNTSLVPVVNTVPGVRMEERSPGSYRLSIRGSLLRSPFGVRNVKIYWNDLALTDAGGNTYLNLIDLGTVGRMELIKGPAGSVYGAGTGGVLIFNSPLVESIRDSMASRWDQHFGIQLNGGSYGLFNEQFRWQANTKNAQWQFSQSHLQSDGYRSNSRMRRESLQLNGSVFTGKRNRLEGLFLLTDLYYRTPGGLTLKQMEEDPRQSRPATPALPSALEQKAGIYNRSFFGGLSDHFTLSPKWSNVSSLFGMFTDFKNPFITNYEHRKEQTIGFRTKMVYDPKTDHSIRWLLGIEWQSTWSTIDSSGNIKGEPDNTLVRDDTRAIQQFYFTQLEWQLLPKLLVQGGVSLNDFKYNLQRVIPDTGTGKIPVNFNLQIVPRLALLYSVRSNMALHFSVSKGYSPPSLAEIRPSAGGFHTNLQAEYGLSYELGWKGSLYQNRFQFDLSLFNFNLKDAIVRRTDSTGAEYFLNAGGTKQNGIELWLNWFALRTPSARFIQQLRVWTSLSLNDFSFSDYQVDNSDYSGNDLTGVPGTVWVSGFDLNFLDHFYWKQTLNYTSRLPLNDANDTYADPYVLVQARLGWRKSSSSHVIEIYGGLDNILNETYSLGNDLNAFGKRYYNPAATINFFAGFNFQF